jgi:IclR family transcriptional regulator, acetate operon repressor
MCHFTEQCSVFCSIDRGCARVQYANLLCVDGNAEHAPNDAAPERPGGLIGAVDNVLRLLRLFEDHEMIRVNQVAREMGLSRSTVHRMLATLSHHQFVEQDEYSRAYKPGPALVDIGLSVVAKIDIRAISHSALVELRDLTGETVHLGFMRGATDVLYLDSVESDQVVRTGSRIGWILPAHSTAGGKVLLAEKSDAEIAALYPSGVLDAPTPRAVTALAELLEQLAEVRRLGYAVNHGESETDVAAVAAVIRDKRGHVRGALVTTAPLSRADEAWMKSTAAATMRVARELGDRVA